MEDNGGIFLELATWSSRVEPGTELGDPYGSLPTLDNLWFYDTVAFIYLNVIGVRN